MGLREKILRYVLQNAVKFNGKANAGAIIGKLIADDPKIKEKIKEISKEIIKTIKKVNSLSLEEQKTKLKEIAPELLEEKKTIKKELVPLKNAINGKVVMRFAPSPSGLMHLGHAITLGVISEYCRMYNGMLILRIEDTNPENIYSPAYELLPKEAQWLTKNNVNKVIIQSDRLKIYYKYVEKLIDKNAVYVCACDPEKYKKLIFDKKKCPCRDLQKQEQMKRWRKMFNGYKQGEAVARVKTNIKDKNPAMRDFPIARINEAKHPRHGNEYRVWPLMNLAVFVDDVEHGMTHIIRGKDHADNAKRQEFLYNYLNKPVPITLFQGKINFTDLQLSCSKTKKAIEEGKYSGWDDIRLPFLAALKRRGYKPHAIIKWALSTGVSLADKRVSKDELFKMINAFNKEIIDPVSSRYFFIEEPVKIKIENSPLFSAELDLHPDNKKGGRKFKVDGNFYISKNDFDNLKNNKLIRLMDCLNFVKGGNKFIFDSLEYEKYKERGEQIIHWLPVSNLVSVEVLMPDNKIKKGLAEPLVKKLRVGDIVQFERFAFCRLDKKTKNKAAFWFAHR